MDAPFACAGGLPFPRRIWVYTNYDCNLSCSYCVARSHPRAERRGIALPVFRRLLEEALEAGIEETFLTGGEPFILPDIHERIEFATALMPTTVLTNGLLLNGTRLERLLPLLGRPLTLQVSLDGHEPAIHDAYRGEGAWQKTVASIRMLSGLGFRVAIGATETWANAGRIDDLLTFVRGMGIPDELFFVRPLARRGFSGEGLELSSADLLPEITVNNDGIYWHPLTTEDDMLVTRSMFPLSEALTLLHERHHALIDGGAWPRPFR